MKSPRPMGRMVIASSLRGFPSSRLRAILAGLPVARGYRLEVKPLRYRTKTEVIRFLYCHEYYHYYLYEILGRKGSAETACDRLALQNLRRRHAHPAVRPHDFDIVLAGDP